MSVVPNSEVRLLGRSEAVRNILADTDCAARSGAKVLITGETGVGKEVVARLIHHRSELQALNLSHTGVSDADLGYLEGLTNLEILSLEQTKITGAGLAHLENMAAVAVLNLKTCDVKADGLEHLAGIRSLKIVYLKGTKVSRAEAKAFKNKMESLAVFFY